MATSKKKKPRKKDVAVVSDPPIVITGGGGGPFPFGTPSSVDIEFTDAAGRKVRIRPKHGGTKIVSAILTVDIVKGGAPKHEELRFDSQTDYRIAIQFTTDPTPIKKSRPASTKKASKKGSKKAGR